MDMLNLTQVNKSLSSFTEVEEPAGKERHHQQSDDARKSISEKDLGQQ